eukprot:SAG31_NODE_25205_length_466_cov_0.700272_1_plen_83_part_01
MRGEESAHGRRPAAAADSALIPGIGDKPKRSTKKPAVTLASPEGSVAAPAPKPQTRVALRLDQLEADLKQADALILGIDQMQ